MSNDNLDGCEDMIPWKQEDNFVPDDYDQFMAENVPHPKVAPINSTVQPIYAERVDLIKEAVDNGQEITIEQEMELFAAKYGYDDEQFMLAVELGLFNADTSSVITIPQEMMDTKLMRYAKHVAEVVQFPFGTAAMVAMASMSAASSLRFCIERKGGNRIPTGIYLCAGQPASAGKTWVLDTFMEKLQDGLIKIKKERKKNAEDKEGAEPNLMPPTRVVTNGTPEGIETTMSAADSGRFILSSAEQGVINNLLNINVQGRAVDNDLVLKGFVGEYHSTVRVTRAGYEGKVFGAIVLIAQKGTARTIITNSKDTGLAERFLFASEPTVLGKRDHMTYREMDKDMAAQYDAAIEFLLMRYDHNPSQEIEQLQKLKFSDDAYVYMTKVKQVCEPVLGEHVDKNEEMMGSTIGKLDIQTMKMAAALHVAEYAKIGSEVPKEVDIKLVKAASKLAVSFLKKLERILIDEEEMGDDAKFNKILSKFDKKNRMTATEISTSLRKNKLFGSRAAVKRTLDQMVYEQRLTAVDKYYIPR
ncbi:MAG: DUF3987 domain-containing protein [Leucothrix sp.]